MNPLDETRRLMAQAALRLHDAAVSGNIIEICLAQEAQLAAFKAHQRAHMDAVLPVKTYVRGMP